MNLDMVESVMKGKFVDVDGDEVQVAVGCMHGVQFTLQIVHCFQIPESVVEIVTKRKCRYVSLDQLHSVGRVGAMPLDE